MTRRFKSGEGHDLITLHERSVQNWGEYINHVKDTEKVWKGNYSVNSDIADPELEIAEPSEARAIIKKMMEMIAIRAKKRYEVVRFSNSQNERQTADKLERFCSAYKAEQRKITQVDLDRMACWLFLQRGRVGIQSLYQKNAKHPKVRQRVFDGLEYFPVYGDNGIDYFTTEKYMSRHALISFFENMDKKALSKLEDASAIMYMLKYDEEGSEIDVNTEVRVIEYWDDTYTSWAVGSHLISTTKHDFGEVTLREAKLGATPLSDNRWSCEPFLGPIINDLKMKASLHSKLANAIEAFFYPYVLVENRDGKLNAFPANSVPLAGIDIAPGTDVKVVNATSNDAELKALIDIISNNIDKNTITDVAWNTSLGEESGFRANLALGLIQDSIADVRDQLEQMFGLSMGDVLMLHERFAPEGGWDYTMLDPSGRHLVQSITAEEIGVHQEVNVTIKPAVPQDLVQMVTIYNQLGQRDPVSGKKVFPDEIRLEMSGLADVIGDMTRFNEELERSELYENDEEVAMLRMESLKAKYYPEIRDMEKQISSMENKRMKSDAARAEREIEKGMSDDLVVPAEVLQDPNKLTQLAQMISQGQLPQHALEVVKQGLPMGAPGEPVAQGGIPENVSPETMALMQQMGIQGPDGLTGYEGMNPEMAPAAVQGAQPRRVVDQPNVEVEGLQEEFDRGALPPPR